jgi:hypothetical protein
MNSYGKRLEQPGADQPMEALLCLCCCELSAREIPRAHLLGRCKRYLPSKQVEDAGISCCQPVAVRWLAPRSAVGCDLFATRTVSVSHVLFLKIKNEAQMAAIQEVQRYW